jgi:pimeloyl-ACP methyl ester carboxylesterase
MVPFRVLPIDLRGLATIGLSLTATLLAFPAHGQQEFIIQLRNGMRLGPGIVSATDSISTNAFQRGGGGGNVENKSILMLDDGLRATYINKAPINILSTEESTATRPEQIILPSAPEAARAGNPPSILAVIGISEFNEYGRRTYSFMTTRGRVDVLQGITLLTPTFAKVEVLRTGTDEFVWDQRIATSSIPADKLRSILYQALDLTKSNEWLRIISFYTQAERFGEAREVMAEALEKFPTELATRKNVLQQLDQLLANQKFEEIKSLRSSGQQKLAAQLLGKFPQGVLSLENQIKLGDEVQSVNQQLRVVAEIAQALQAQVEKLDPADQQLLGPWMSEFLDEVNLETIARMADFQRLRGDADTPTENLVAYAIGGWLLGPGAGIDNFAVAKSLLRVRTLVTEYLNDATEPRRAEVLQQLRGEEGAEPPLLAKLLNTMKPPLPVPAQQEDDPQGLLRLSVQRPGLSAISYVVQLPPEYDPNRKYPCLLALPGRGEPPELEIDFWCGINIEYSGTTFRFGHATRKGYIVVSPDWFPSEQAEYQYTEGEHARILSVLRDAFRTFSIDTDRVYVTGHYDGATAAWDLAVSHPDLWAGAIMISPGADKYIVQYSENLRAPAKSPDPIPLGTYIVYGDSDGTRLDTKLGTVGTRYLTSPAYDTIVVEYRGRGRERFAAEIPRIFQWMELSTHRRQRAPQSIETRAMRSGDRFFYWLEAPALLANNAGNPLLFDPSAYGIFQAKLLDSANNGVSISRIPSENRSAIVWLTPAMVDFGRTITVTLLGKKSRHDLSPDIGIMLEDVRRRGDRMHVYWQKIDLQ